MSSFSPYSFSTLTPTQSQQISFSDYLLENQSTAPSADTLTHNLLSRPTPNSTNKQSVKPSLKASNVYTKGNITYFPGTFSKATRLQSTTSDMNPSRQRGLRKEVYAFKNPNDLIDMQRYFLYDCSKRESLRLRNWLFFALGINMGFRVSDLCKLRWENIFIPHTETFNNSDWNQLTETKTGKTRQVVITPAAQKAINFYISSLDLNPLDLNPRSYVFWSNKKSELHVQPDTMHDWIKKAARALDLPFNVGTHSMRKTFGYMLYKSTGNDIGVVQAALNHSSTKNTLRYINMTQETMREAYNTLPDMVWTPT